MNKKTKTNAWKIQETLENLTTGKTQYYDITIDTHQEDGILNVSISVNECPRGQRPTTWYSNDVTKWLEDKGLRIDKAMKQDVLRDIDGCKATYVFSLKKEKKIIPKSKKSVNKKNLYKAED